MGGYPCCIHKYFYVYLITGHFILWNTITLKSQSHSNTNNTHLNSFTIIPNKNIDSHLFSCYHNTNDAFLIPRATHCTFERSSYQEHPTHLLLATKLYILAKKISTISQQPNNFYYFVLMLIFFLCGYSIK